MTKSLISFDFAIKYLLKDKGDYDIVEGFISALLAAEGYSPVKIKALLDTESNKETRLLKRSIADLIVEDEQGHKYIVEIERQYTNNFIDKACFNTSRLIVDSIGASEDYTTIKKVFHISLLYFAWGNMTKPLYHGKTIIREIDTKNPIDLHIADQGGRIYDASHIFPEYILISVPLFDDVVKKEIDEWLYIMKNSEVREDFKSPYMKKVAERLSILKMNAQEKDEYYRYLKETLTQRDVVTAAEEKGEARGIEKGREERNIEIAKNLLAQGVDICTISTATGLTEEEIRKMVH
jgi:predicted transposase/invertase (TIGR01784 family)